jgi:hypothetical protein
MLRETSSARIIVAWPVGTLIILTGRAVVTIRLMSARRKRAKGKCRLRWEYLGRAPRTSERLEKRSPTRLRLSAQIYTPIITGISASRKSKLGQRKFINYLF